jgi:tRNA threonylcarbamoyladenosine biosynthesis protein TsaB
LIWQGLAVGLPYNGIPLITLAVDTTTSGGSTAVLRDERVIGSVSTWTEETYSSRMFRQVEFLLEELGLGLDQVDLFAVASGPGSFTGLRVGLAAIKAWAEVYGKPVAGVSALEAIAEESRSASPLLVPAFDARRGEVYFGVYRREGDLRAPKLVLQAEHSVMTPVDFLNEMRVLAGKEALTIVTPTPETLAGVTGGAAGSDGIVEGAGGIRVEVVANILAPAVGLLAVRRARSGITGDSLTLEANYVRRTDAELKWKAL